MQEQAYPIFRISAQWTERNKDGEVIQNSTSFDIMYPIGSTVSVANQDALDWWEKFQDSTGFGKDKPPLRERLVDILNISVRFLETETWCAGWFQHSTRNTHLDDGSILVSFANFVQRKRLENIKNGHYETERVYPNKKPYFCLMGAEDEWRWKICRCEHCQKRGIVMIDH